MNTTTRTSALTALTMAGLLWGTSVPLSKTALGGFGPLWLTVIRFAVAGVLLMVVLRPRLRTVRPTVLVAGAIGYGLGIAIQNIGLTMTSVTHAALLIGSVPVLVAVLAVVVDRARVAALAWIGFGVSLAGIALVARAGGGSASLGGDAVVLLSVLISAGFTIVQARLLPGSDVIAVSAAQFFGSVLLVLPVAVVVEGLPPLGSALGAAAAVPVPALLALVALATIGTVLPYTLFAFGQTGVAPQVAGAFLNLETLVAAVLGATLFGEPMGMVQVVGAAGLLGGIWLSAERKRDRTSTAPVPERARSLTLIGVETEPPVPDLAPRLATAHVVRAITSATQPQARRWKPPSPRRAAVVTGSLRPPAGGPQPRRDQPKNLRRRSASKPIEVCQQRPPGRSR